MPNEGTQDSAVITCRVYLDAFKPGRNLVRVGGMYSPRSRLNFMEDSGVLNTGCPTYKFKDSCKGYQLRNSSVKCFGSVCAKHMGLSWLIRSWGTSILQIVGLTPRFATQLPKALATIHEVKFTFARSIFVGQASPEEGFRTS